MNTDSILGHSDKMEQFLISWQDPGPFSKKKILIHVFHVGSVYRRGTFYENYKLSYPDSWKWWRNLEQIPKKNNKNMLKMSLPERGFA